MPLEWPDPQPDPAKANTKDADTRTVLLQEYGDHGQWARHYSAVRMTLGTFFLTAATGMITLRWDTPQAAVAWTAGVVLVIGAALFMFFSNLTFYHMNKQFDIMDKYRGKLGGASAPKRFEFWRWRGLGGLFAIAFVVAFLAFDGLWFVYSKPKPGQANQIVLPMKVKVGQQPEITIDVPVNVMVP